jgi:hypothetical protein
MSEGVCNTSTAIRIRVLNTDLLVRNANRNDTWYEQRIPFKGRKTYSKLAGIGQLWHSSQQQSDESLSLSLSLSLSPSGLLTYYIRFAQRYSVWLAFEWHKIRSSPRKSAILTGQSVISVSCQNDLLTLPSIITTDFIPTLNCPCSWCNVFYTLHV